MNKILFWSVMLYAFTNLNCQTVNNSYNLSKENIILKNPDLVKLTDNKSIEIIGVTDSGIIVLGKDQKFYNYSENSKEIRPYTAEIKNGNSKAIRTLVKNNLIFRIGYLDLPEDNDGLTNKIVRNTNYQDLWIQYKNRNIKIDSFPFYYLDKYIGCNFSSDGEKLVCNPYSYLSATYSSNVDNKFYVYDLQYLNLEKVNRQIINCERCMNTFLINSTFFFVKEIAIGHGYDGYYKNIYKAPFKDIKDTVQIAHDIELINITPDGKFILGTKRLYGEHPPLIIEVSTKRYQYILGRDYPIDYSYYSLQKGKFAFDFSDYIVYIEFPKEYPFNALENTTFQNTTKAQNENFWKKYQHEPLK